MPLDDTLISKEKDGAFNEEYCKWCYADGEYTYSDMDDLIDVCVVHMAKNGFSEDEARAYMKGVLPNLNYWKNHAKLGGGEQFERLKRQLIDEFNALNIAGMPKVEKLNALVGGYVNLAYPLPSGNDVRFLKDEATYFGNQLESTLDDGRCFGILANADFLLVSTYLAGGADPNLLLYKKR